MSANQRALSGAGRLRLGLGSVLSLGLCLVAAGRTRAPVGAPAAGPVSVPVSHPVEREVTDYADFTARIAAVGSAAVRAHVWGYLQKVHFKGRGDRQEGGSPSSTWCRRISPEVAAPRCAAVWAPPCCGAPSA